MIGFDFLLDAEAAVRHLRRMPSWKEFEAAAPELAEQVRQRLDAHTHKTIATVRRDGSPRISGIETAFRDGELWIGSMWQARKAHDLQRDPRFALHSGSDEPSDWKGDAKLAGVAEEITEPERANEGDSRRTCSGSTCARSSTVALNEKRNAIVITVWTPDRGVRTIERA